MAGLRVYRDLLGNRALMRLLVGEFVSGIGDWLYIVAIFVVIYRESGNAALVGAFGGIRLLPYVILSVPAGIIADRFDRRMVLLVSDLFRGALMAIMAILVATGAGTLPVAALAILAASGSAFFYPAIGAYLPALAKDERQLGPANSAWASLQNVSYVAGPAIGGLVLAFGSVVVAFVLNALTFVFVAVILWGLPPSRARHDPSVEVQVSGDSATGSRDPADSADSAATRLPASNVTGSPSPAPGDLSPGGAMATGPDGGTGVPEPPRLQLRPLAGLTVVQLMAGFLGGGFQVITVILAINVLNAGEQANGYLNAAIGVGGLIGAIGAGALVLRRHLGLPLLLGAVITGLGAIALGAASSLPFALVAIGVSSAGSLIIDVVTTTIFQRLVPDELRGRGVGILMAVTTLTGASGAFLLPVLLTTFGPFESLGAAGIATIIFTAAGLVLIGAAADRPPTPYEATVARVLTLPLFVGVPRSRMETAMHRVVELPVSAGDVVVAQGDQADRFFIIESGTFTVSQVHPPDADPVVLRQLGPDEVFGELGLLNRTPRTATVTAATEGTLLALGRDDFLALVGASQDFRGRLLGLYAGSGTRS